MIIPVKCFTCGTVLGNKYRWYLSEVKKMKSKDKEDIVTVEYLTEEMVDKTPEGIVMDRLRLNKMCCRRHMLTHVDIE
jgi:DNA-directed RNA polymerase subunit N (RpoN/RPB10)